LKYPFIFLRSYKKGAVLNLQGCKYDGLNLIAYNKDLRFGEEYKKITPIFD